MKFQSWNVNICKIAIFSNSTCISYVHTSDISKEYILYKEQYVQYIQEIRQTSLKIST